MSINTNIRLIMVYSMPDGAKRQACGDIVQAIDHGLQSSKLDMSTSDEIKALRDKGMELHKAGHHRESEKTLAEAMRMLLMAK